MSRWTEVDAVSDRSLCELLRMIPARLSALDTINLETLAAKLVEPREVVPP